MADLSALVNGRARSPGAASSASTGICHSRDIPRFVSSEQVVTLTTIDFPSGDGTGEATRGSAHKSSGVIGRFTPEGRLRTESAPFSGVRRGFLVCIDSPHVFVSPIDRERARREDSTAL